MFGMKRLELFRSVLLQVVFYGGFIKLIGFTLDDLDGILGTMSEAGTETVAEIIGDQLGLAINDLNSTFGAGRHTKPATITLVLIYNYDFPFHASTPFHYGSF